MIRSASVGHCISPGQTSRGEETRTPGLLLPKQVRYQLRYSPALLDATGPTRLRRVGSDAANSPWAGGELLDDGQ